VVRDFEPVGVLDTIQAAKVTIAFFVPAMLAAVCSVADISARKLSLRRVFYSGAPISPVALTKAMASLRCDFIQIYGLTEATGAFAQCRRMSTIQTGRWRIYCSRRAGLTLVEVRVVSTAAECDVPFGEIGEIWTRSEQNLVGYWNDAEQTARALTPDGWLADRRSRPR